MKTKIAKILLLVLSLALLIGASVCIYTSADENSECSIKSINIAHGDKVRVLMAVETNVPNPEENVVVEYTLNGEVKTAEFWKYVDIYGDGVEYPIFYTEGISAKDIGEDVIAVTYKKGENSSLSSSKNISVAQYLYLKLYNEGYVNATEGSDLNKKLFYERMLAYGASAQQVLWNNLADNADTQRVLVTDYIPVKLTGATVDDSSFVLLKKPGYITPKYDGNDLFLGWNVKYGSETSLLYSSAVYVDSFTAISPITAVKGDILTFDEAYTTFVTNLSVSGTATNLNFTESGVKVENTGKTNTGINGVVATASVKEEANGNKYLNVHSLGRGDTSDRAHSVALPFAQKLTEDANVTILSFDLRGTGSSDAIEIMLRPSSTVHVQFNQVCGVGLKGNGEEWTNFRLEYYDAEDVVQLYINGVYQKNLKGAGNDISALGNTVYANIGVYNGRGATDIDIDNVALYATTKTYEILPQGIPHNFEGNYVFQSGNIIADNTSEERGYDFGYGVSVYGAGKTWECEAGVQILGDEGSRYLRMYGGPRINTNDRGWVLTIAGKKNLVPKSAANRTNIEFDLMVESSPALPSGSTGSTGGSSLLDFSFYFGNKFVRFDPVNKNGNLTLAGNTFAAINEWYTVRFEICHDTCTINIYSRPKGAADWTLTSTIPKSVPLGAEASYGVMTNLSSEFTHLNICGLNSSQSFAISVDNVTVYTATTK